jgi:hypothetical protein
VNLQDTLVVLDTCVMLKPRMSDVIMDLRAEEVMSVHWTETIDDEFLRNFQRLFEHSETAATRRLGAMKRRCPEWEVFVSETDFSDVPDEVDEKDRHVAAAALALRNSIEGDEDPFDVLIVTDNIKDLAPEQMANLGVRVMTSGDFLNEVFTAEPAAMERAIDQAVRDLRSPPYTLQELLFALREQGAHLMVDGVAATRGVIPKRKPRTGSEP